MQKLTRHQGAKTLAAALFALVGTSAFAITKAYTFGATLDDPTSKNGNAEGNAAVLRTEAGIQFPDELLVELSPASNKAALIQTLDGQSGDRAKAAQEAAAAQAEVELGLGRAKIEKEKSASSLNSARAAKFAVETESDPDAAYERVEQERIQADRDESQERLAIDRERIAMEERNSRRQTALELTKIHSQETIAAKNNEAKVKTAAMKPKPKPPTKSGGKAKTPARKR